MLMVDYNLYEDLDGRFPQKRVFVVRDEVLYFSEALGFSLLIGKSGPAPQSDSIPENDVRTFLWEHL